MVEPLYILLRKHILAIEMQLAIHNLVSKHGDVL